MVNVSERYYKRFNSQVKQERAQSLTSSIHFPILSSQFLVLGSQFSVLGSHLGTSTRARMRDIAVSGVNPSTSASGLRMIRWRYTGRAQKLDIIGRNICAILHRRPGFGSDQQAD
jgi:hypothetical protein